MKKIVRYIMFIFIFSFACMGCGDNKSQENESKKNSESTTDSNELQVGDTTEAMAIPDNTDTEEEQEERINYAAELMPKENGETIYVYVLDDGSANQIEYFKKTYPQFANQVEVRKVDVDEEEYVVAITDMLKEEKETPSVVVCKDDMLWDMISSNVYKDLKEIGLTDEMHENAYGYTKEFATKESALMAMTWRSNPGVFIYRSDIAEEVLGTSEPDAVQEYVKDWDSFFTTAEKMKESEYYMLSSSNDIVLPFVEQSETPLVDGQQLNIDENIVALLEVARNLVDQGYVAGNSTVGDDEWLNAVNGRVFGCFGSEETIDKYLNDVLSDNYGNRRICEGPSNYHCGTSYIGVTNKCPNEKLAALLIYTLCCDEDVMYEMCETEDIFVNNRQVISKVLTEGKGAYEALGGQSTYGIWDIASDSINLKSPTKYDGVLIDALYKVVVEYVSADMADVDAAIESIENIILEQCEELKIDK